MTIRRQEIPLDSLDEQPSLQAMPAANKQATYDIQAVNEQLLLAGLREQTLADQLRLQLAFTTAIATSLGEGVYVLDTTGRCTFANPAAEHMLGQTATELHGQHISALFPIAVNRNTLSNTLTSALVDVLHLGTVYRDEDAQFVNQDGSTFPTAYCAAPIITDGSIVGAVITFRDMTEVRQLQRAREEYLALISHDLRAPLTALLGRAQLLWRRLTQHGLAQEAQSASIIVECGLRLNNMIEELLKRSRIDVALGARQRSVIDLVQVVQQMIDQTITPDDSARVTLDAVSTLPMVVEAVQIERVIVNLLTNAVKFSPPDRPIMVRVFQQAGHAIITITDHGIGIAPADHAHLFEKYYRAQTVGQIAGNGLGLYGSRLIVEAHDGRLWAESTFGEGSTFTVTLPLPADAHMGGLARGSLPAPLDN